LKGRCLALFIVPASSVIVLLARIRGPGTFKLGSNSLSQI